MGLRGALLLLWVALSGCAGGPEPREADQTVRAERRHRRHRRHRRRRRPRRIVVRAPVSAGPARRVLRGVCVPAESCGRFAGCALAEEEPDPDAPGDIRYRVRRYDTDPARVDDIFAWSRLCWAEGLGRACVDALDAGGTCPPSAGALAPTPPPRCELHDGICGPVTPTAPAVDAGAPATDGGTPAP